MLRPRRATSRSNVLVGFCCVSIVVILWLAVANKSVDGPDTTGNPTKPPEVTGPKTKPPGSHLLALSQVNNRAGTVWPKPAIYPPRSRPSPSMKYLDREFTKIYVDTPGATNELRQKLIDLVTQTVAVFWGDLSKLPKQSELSPESNIITETSALRINLSGGNKMLDPPAGENEHYKISSKQDTNYIEIDAESFSGVVHALQTLKEMIVCYYANKTTVSLVASTISIEDKPRFQHRGLLMDTGRAFLSVPFIEKIIDGLSILKMNVLHWHITDDQSFPFESKKFPELHEKGAGWLGYTHNKESSQSAQTPGRFYSQAQIKSLVAYAEVRGVRIIPELDIPAHTRSWGMAFPNVSSNCPNYIRQRANHLKGEYVVNIPLDITNPFTYEVISGLITELRSLFRDSILHVGGDEFFPDCWNEDTEQTGRVQKLLGTTDFKSRRKYFDTKLRKIISDIDPSTKLMYWSEAFTDDIIPDLPSAEKANTVVQIWKNSELKKTIRAGFPSIKSNGYYLDLQESHLSWWHFYSDDPKAEVDSPHLIGAEACAWELTEGTSWSEEGGNIGKWYRGWPAKVWLKLIAFSENMWSGASARGKTADVITEHIRLTIAHMRAMGIKMPAFCHGNDPNLSDPEHCFPPF